MKRRRKGMLGVCVSVCLFAKKFGKTTNIDGSNKLLAEQHAFAKTFWLQSYENLYHSQLLFPDLRRLLGTTRHI